MQDLFQVTVSFESKEVDLIDYISYLLIEYGASGTQVKYAAGYLENHPNLFGEIPESLPQAVLDHPTQVLAYFEDSVSLEDLGQHLQDQLPIPFEIEGGMIHQENWQDNWLKYYHVQEISRFIKIVPVWESYQPQFADEKLVYLDPGVAFGTGDHPTTQLGGQALELVLRGGETVYDVGTGSGVLSFIAGHLGATKVKGMDLDPQAVDAAKKNLTHQQFGETSPDLEFFVNDRLQGIEEEAQVIVANILPHILVGMFEDAYRLLPPSGYLILGGIMEDKLEEILDHLDQERWEILQVNFLKGWVGLIIQKKE